VGSRITALTVSEHARQVWDLGNAAAVVFALELDR
jgi:hypothetical protein